VLYAKLNIAYGHIRQGDTQIAESCYRDIINTAPAEWPFMIAEAHYRLGAIQESRDPVAARTHYLRALELSPSHAYAHNDLAIMLLMEGNTEAGIDHLQQAIRTNPAYTPARLNLQRALKTQRASRM